MKRLITLVMALCLYALSMSSVSAQESGDFKFGFRGGYYFRTNAFGVGVYGTYGLANWLNIEPGVNMILKKHCSVDVYCDFQVPLEIATYWTVYPIVGVSVNDITSHKGAVDGWAGGLNLGLGTRYELNSRWSANLQVKWMGRLPRQHQSAVIAAVGIDYNF